MKQFKVRYFKTEEHYEHNISDVYDDTFYTDDGAIAKCQDLLYRRLYYCAEYFEINMPNTVIGRITINDFDRVKYRKQIQENINNRFKNGKSI